jgi:hypothetical protein
MTSARQHLIEATSTEDFFNRIAADYTVMFDMSTLSCPGEEDGQLIPTNLNYAKDEASKLLMRKYAAVRKALMSYARAYPTNKHLDAFADCERKYAPAGASDDKMRRAVNAVQQIKRQEARSRAA